MDEGLKELIAQVDDDYLAGLSNKGILKRAYKDLEQENCAMDLQEGEVRVKLKEESCVIRRPFGESSCSCPSRSICRHIVTAILWLKRMIAEESAEASESAESAGLRFPEFLEMPTERLIKACGSSAFRKFLAHVRGGLPDVKVSSIVTVELPWEGASVKLLEPLAYSTCSCHSKELCTHKAQALLVWRLREGACTLRELEAGQEAEKALDPEQVREACDSVREAVGLQLWTGLSRQSPEVSESLERLALISHRAGLADMERRLREAAAGYVQYFGRKAAFREEELLYSLLRVYRLADCIQKAENAEKLRQLAGVFREDFEPVGNLALVGMGSRSFQSKTGYEGEIYYFLDTAEGRYLTWTDARPTFYEGNEKRRQAALKNGPAPWGLNCAREQLPEMELVLSDAKLAYGGRLSASQETKGELIGRRNLYAEAVCQRIIWDYRSLPEIYFAGMRSAVAAEETETGAEAEAGTDALEPGGANEGAREQGKMPGNAQTSAVPGGGRREKPVLLGAVRWGNTEFDRISQRFSWMIFDENGRHVYISLTYTKEEKMTIRLLERLEKRMKERKYASIVFFGNLYMAEGRLCLYPVEFWLQEDERLLKAKTEAAGREGRSRAETALPGKEVLDVMEQYLREAKRQLADLFVSGIASVGEELAERILACSREGEELGLHQAGEALARIGDLLHAKRHQMEFSAEPLLEAWEGLERYFRACEEKVSRDRAYLGLGEGTEAGEG